MTHDEKIRFLDNLDAAIKFHQKNQNDPYEIGNAVIASLLEVRTAFAKAVHMENYTKELNSPAV